MRTHRRQGARGQTAVIFTLFLVPVLGITGLAIDAGRMYAARRKVQAGVDIAASVGAHEEMRPAGERTSFQRAASAYLEKNGITRSEGYRITYHNPPKSGSYAGDKDAYEVVVTRQMPTTFMRLLGQRKSPVEARAVAVVKKTGIGILVLSRTKCKAFHMKGSGSNLTLMRGLLHTNSNCGKEAMKVSGKATITMRQPPTVVGGAVVNGFVTPDPEEGADFVEDPLADLPLPPRFLPVQHGVRSLKDGKCAEGDIYKPVNGEVLCPGTYYCGIKVEDNVSVTFDTCGMPPSEAVYHLTGSKSGKKALEIKKNTSVVLNRATIYVKAHPRDNSDKKCGEIKIDKHANLDFKAPADGIYEGILMVADRDCKEKKLQLTENVLAGMVGEIYVPTWKTELKGSSGKKASQVGLNVSFITNLLKIDKNFDATDDGLPDLEYRPPDMTFNALAGGSARRVLLAE